MNELDYKKQIWFLCKEKGKNLVNIGLEFTKKDMMQKYNSFDFLREEFAANARYLHRGYYCPSPIWDSILDNSSRGKILKCPQKTSKISHRYFYDSCNKLRIVESTLPGGRKKREYLIYDKNAIYGVAFDEWGTLVGASEEVYNQGKIETYFSASCYVNFEDRIDWGITSIHYEKYYYKEQQLIEADCYYTSFWLDDEDFSLTELDSFICGARYRFELDNNKNLKFYRIIGSDSPP